ncbi:hypothetical protein N182_36450 [Sinorhizobium sp. GL2]|nr:hypothetical protein N182_36450 [Sinorhizobium sp. GL2]
MKLEWFRLHSDGAVPEVGTLERDWMDETPSRFAYRCLPLAIANQMGWVVKNEHDFDAVWDGGIGVESVRIHCNGERKVSSHFGSGILTFNLDGLIRTEPGVGVFVTGPINEPKDAIAPLSGFVETEWSPYTFTMNWKFTRADTIVRFRAGDPIATIIPLSVGIIEEQRPAVKDMEDDPLLAHRYRSWSDSRTDFNATLAVPDSPARQMGWQKHYHQGRDIEGAPISTNHRTKLKLKPFADK